MSKRLTKIFLILVAIAFASSASCLEKQNSEEYSIKQILKTYGKDNLSSKPPFQGGYINFGYWKNIIPNSNEPIISKQHRIEASFALYKLIIDYLNIKKTDSILEAGCGLGYGCKYIANKYNPANLTCIDITPEQIERAKSIHQAEIKNSTLKFEISSADNINKPQESYDKIYSVEAAQYFPSMTKFSKEAFRLLKSNGLLVITAHFSTNQEGFKAAKNLLPTVSESIDRMIPINDVRKAFELSGFKEIKVETIGQYVFEGFDRWISQINDQPWAHNIFQLYQAGHIDYYVLIFQKP